MDKANSGYGREKELAELFHVQPNQFSGGRWEYGKYDALDEARVFDFKSTEKNEWVIHFQDLYQLGIHAQQRGLIALYVVDFLHPFVRVETVRGYRKVTFEPQQFVVLSKEDFDTIWERAKSHS